MNINIQKGNLFELDREKYVLAHCISQDCALGAGIALEFRKRFKDMPSYCERVIKENHLEYPCVIPYYTKELKVLNLVTKRFYYNKPTYNTITSTIREMAFICNKSNIKYLGMPLIGCGLDKLKWEKVREIIEEEFKDIDIEIEVRYL